MKKFFALSSLVIACLSTGLSADQTLLLRQPALSSDHLAFVYAGDLWVAGQDGSEARRLTSSPAQEQAPSFSPDGSMIVFSADYEDNVDVYVVPTAGGQPQRLTWHPADDIPTGWTSDGDSVVFFSSRERDHGRSAQLYHVALQGGLPTKQMEARIYRGVYDSAGGRLAYIAHGSGYNGLFGGSSGWKGYRGGTTPAIQIMALGTQVVTTVPGERSTNFSPFWLDGKVYFLSDRDDEIFNVYRFDPAKGDVEKISAESVWDVRAAHGHGDVIVYEAGGRLFRLGKEGGEASEIAISIAPDLPQLREQWKDASETIESSVLSPTGKRALVTARGDVFSIPVDEGSTRNLDPSPQHREYTALWSPDGDTVAYVSESENGQDLVVVDQKGRSESKRFALGPYFYQLEAWGGGDDARIVFQDNHLGLHAIEVATGEITTISTGARRERIEVAFSPDGLWLSYTEEMPNFHKDLMLYNFETGTSTRISDGYADVASPAFSRDGKTLYFAASTNSGPLQVGLNMTSQERPYRAGLYALVLAADGRSPLLPEAGDENAEEGEDEGDEKKGEDKKDDDEEETTESTRIDLEGLSSRMVALPVAKANYGNLEVAEDGALFYVHGVQPGGTREPPGGDAASENRLVRFDFEEKEAKTALTGVAGFSLSADGKHMIIGKVDGSLAVAEVAAELEPKPLDMSGLKARIDPRREWVQIFDEAWRMEKDYFYADNLHGIDWQAVHDRYRPLVDHVGRREDLNELIVEMIAELQAGHNRAGRGDVHREKAVTTGLLGANFEIDNGRYRFARVYTGETWNPFVDAPLATPGNAAATGEYLLAIDGVELTAEDNIFARLQNTVGKQVALKVAKDASGKGAREIVVEPTRSERTLRLWSWIEDNRRAVHEASDGRVGYIYLPNTAGAGFTYFNRMFFSQVDREALIIDERSNAGGQAANYITDVLSRRHLSGWKDRDGMTYNTPAGAMHGPKVMLIDQDAGSGGDYLPYSFRTLGIGKLIGTTTWGGLIGISANPSLVDGGFLTVPFFRFYDTEMNWSVENEGVAPDIEVALDPIATNEGRDTQLEVAIEEVLAQLEGFDSGVSSDAPPLPTELGE